MKSKRLTHNREKPPRWAQRLMQCITAPHLREELQGDLKELFHKRAQRYSYAKARRMYVWDLVRLLHPRLWRRESNTDRNSHYHPTSNSYQTFLLTPTMLRNYFTIAWRNFIYNKIFSIINLLGLGLGMASSLIIFLWIQDELSIDAYHVNGKQLYRVMERQIYDRKVEATSNTPGLLPDALKKRFPEIKYAVGFSWEEQHAFAVGDKMNKENGRSAGADWFKMFTLPLLEGNPETALNAPANVAISRKLAENYFGSPQAAIGKSVRVDNKADYQISAVFENLPQNSLDRYDYLFSWEDFLKRNEYLKDWGNNAPRTYIQVSQARNGEPTDVARLETKLKPLLRELNPSLKESNSDIQLFLQPYEEAYLYSNFKNGYQDGGRIEYVRLFGLVGAVILLIACINYMNLATARSLKRAREVGVRKVVGAVRTLLVGQFLAEALLLTLLSLVLALGLVWLLLPLFNTLTDKSITLRFNHASFWIILLSMTLLTGLVAGSYPAFFLSSLNPIRVLKGSLRFGSGVRLFRQGLVVFQFVLSLLLIISTIVVYRQLNYIQTKNLGYDRENLIYITAEGDLAEKYATFKQELLNSPGIQSLTYMDGTPTNTNASTGNVQWPSKSPDVNIQFLFSKVDYDFTKTLKLKLTAGRDFSKEYGMDSVSYLINQTAACSIGYQNPVGKPLTLFGKSGTIIGLIEDYHLTSLHIPIEPLVVTLSPNVARKNLIIRTQPGQSKEALASIENLWQELNPKIPFSYKFADTEFQKIYHSETVVGTLANYFALLAIVISCLGLFGLVTFTAEQRTKEISVRKVLGASIPSIVTLLTGDFFKLVIIAILIASPLAWWTMNQWLNNFAYRVDIEWWIFALAGLVAMSITFLTISFQSIKAALVNPVKSLRSE